MQVCAHSIVPSDVMGRILVSSVMTPSHKAQTVRVKQVGSGHDVSFMVAPAPVGAKAAGARFHYSAINM